MRLAPWDMREPHCDGPWSREGLEGVMGGAAECAGLLWHGAALPLTESAGFLSEGKQTRTARPLEAATLGTGSSRSERKIQRVLRTELFSLRT